MIINIITRELSVHLVFFPPPVSYFQGSLLAVVLLAKSSRQSHLGLKRTVHTAQWQ